MKTAMQELIDNLIEYGWLPADASNLKQSFLEPALEKEKEQMIEFGQFVSKNGWVACSMEDFLENYKKTKNNSLPELLDKDGSPMRKVNLTKESQDLLDISINELNK